MATRALGTLTLDLVAKTGGFTDGFKRAEQTSKKSTGNISHHVERMKDSVKDHLKEIAAAIAVAFTIEHGIDSLKEAIETMDKLSKTASKVAMPTEQFSALTYAAQLADVSMEDLTGAMGKLAKSLGAAQNPTSKQAKIFAAFGIATKDARGNMRNLNDVFDDFADKYAKIKDSPEALAAGMALFGKGFQTIIPAIRNGSGEIKDLEEEAKKLGLVLDKETGEKAEQFNDDLTRLSLAARGVWMEVAKELLPTLTEWSGELVDLAKDHDTVNNFAQAMMRVLHGVAAAANAVAAAFKVMTGGIRASVTSVATLVEQINIKSDAIDQENELRWQGRNAEADKVRAAAQTRLRRTSEFGAEEVKNTIFDSASGVNDSINNISKNIGAMTDMPSTKRKIPAPPPAIESAAEAARKKAASARAAAESESLRKSLRGALGSDKEGKDPKKAAEELEAAFSRLNETVQGIHDKVDQSNKPYAEYAKTMRDVSKEASEAVKKGASLAQVQELVGKASADAAVILKRELEAPMRAAREYDQSLKDQLKTRTEMIALQANSIGMSAKEADRYKELTQITLDGEKAIADFKKSYADSLAEGKPNATEEQYKSELKSLTDYWANVKSITEDGYKKMDDASASFKNGFNSGIKDFVNEQKDVAASAKSIAGDFANGMSDAFTEIVTGSKSAKDALKDFVNNIEKEITSFVSKRLISKMFDTDGSGSGGGLFGGILNMFSNGGNKSAQSAQASGGAKPGGTSVGGWAGMISSVLDMFSEHRAVGGGVAAGSAYRVNENGPEILSVGGRDFLMTGNKAGHVTPISNSTTRTNSVNMVNNYQFAAPVDLTTQTQVAKRQAYLLSQSQRFA